jgi:predicted phosphohydrolase
MTCVAWLTDIHLNFVANDQARWDTFIEEVRGTRADTILIGGDVAEAHDLVTWLRLMDDALQRPVYFVLGNHDFYFGSIRGMRGRMRQLCQERPRLHYLTQEDVIELAPDVGLVGHDGWADARIGDYENSTVMMNDYLLIRELAHMSRLERRPLLRQLGDAAADHVRRTLPQALDRYSHVILLTHVPPFREACWYRGRISDDEWTPHFTCHAVGQALLEIMSGHADRTVTVLCGHTHSSGTYRPLETLVVLTGGAEYGRPHVQTVFEL